MQPEILKNEFFVNKDKELNSNFIEKYLFFAKKEKINDKIIV